MAGLVSSNRKIFPQHEYWRRLFLGDSLYNRSGLFLVYGSDHRCPLFDDTGFFAGDLRQRVSQIIPMLHGDVGNNGNGRRYDICGIIAPSHTGFDYSPIHFLSVEFVQCHGGGEFKKGRAPVSVMDLLYRLIGFYHIGV